MLRPRPFVWFAVTCALVVFTSAGRLIDAGAAAQAPARLVAIGDLHADLGAARRAFQLAGATDERDAWIGGNLVVVQMGDLIGRGKEDRAVLDFVIDLQARAKAAGGTLHVLIGNHEVFAARPDHRWVDPDAFAAFGDLPDLNLRHPRLADLPDAQRARAAALMPGAVYARQLSAFPAVLRIGDTVFAHAGVLPLWARYGIDRINADVRDWLAGRTEEPAATRGLDDGSLDDGVMWSRHFAAAPESMACALLKESLSILGAKRMVIAHTVQKSITPRCGEQVWAIDVGISRYYGGALQVLEITGDTQVRVIPLGRYFEARRERSSFASPTAAPMPTSTNVLGSGTGSGGSGGGSYGGGGGGSSGGGGGSLGGGVGVGVGPGGGGVGVGVGVGPGGTSNGVGVGPGPGGVVGGIGTPGGGNQPGGENPPGGTPPPGGVIPGGVIENGLPLGALKDGTGPAGVTELADC